MSLKVKRHNAALMPLRTQDLLSALIRNPRFITVVIPRLHRQLTIRRFTQRVASSSSPASALSASQLCTTNALYQSRRLDLRIARDEHMAKHEWAAVLAMYHV